MTEVRPLVPIGRRTWTPFGLRRQWRTTTWGRPRGRAARLPRQCGGAPPSACRRTGSPPPLVRPCRAEPAPARVLSAHWLASAAHFQLAGPGHCAYVIVAGTRYERFAVLIVPSSVMVADRDGELLRHGPGRMGSGDGDCDLRQVPPSKEMCSVLMAGQTTRASRTGFAVHHSSQCLPATPSGPRELSPCCVLSEGTTGRWAGFHVQGALSDSRRSLPLDPFDSRKSMGNGSRRSLAGSTGPHSYRSFASGKSGDLAQVRPPLCSWPSFTGQLA